MGESSPEPYAALLGGRRVYGEARNVADRVADIYFSDKIVIPQGVDVGGGRLDEFYRRAEITTPRFESAYMVRVRDHGHDTHAVRGLREHLREDDCMTAAIVLGEEQTEGRPISRVITTQRYSGVIEVHSAQFEREFEVVPLTTTG